MYIQDDGNCGMSENDGGGATRCSTESSRGVSSCVRDIEAYNLEPNRISRAQRTYIMELTLLEFHA